MRCRRLASAVAKGAELGSVVSPAAAIALGVALLACGPGPRHNLVVIAVDTLRWDHVGSYGADRDTSPSIDALARSGTRFERAYASAPWTQPSVASMLTGLYPASHGVDRLLRVLPDSADTLAEVLQRAGYATGCVVSHFVIGPKFNFDQGCDTFVHGSALGGGRFSTPGVTERSTELLDQLARDGRPFFLFVHYFDPHYDYQRHRRYGFAAESQGRLTGGETIAELRALSPPPNAAERQFVRDLYDEEVRFTDAGIGRLLAKLGRTGKADNTVVVVVADHGEEFFDRGWLGHTRTLYEELLRVPLVIRTTAGAAIGRTVHEPVSLVALPPTLLELVGVDRDGLPFQARSFASLVHGKPGWEPEPVYAETEYWRHDPNAAPDPATGELVGTQLERRHAVIRGRYKLIVDRNTRLPELYDLVADPREQNDLYAANPRVAEEMERLLEAQAERAAAGRLSGAATAGPPSAAERAMLEQLGYIAD